MKKIIYLFLILSVSLSLFCTQSKAQTDLKWYGFNEGYQKAVNEKRPVIVDFYADWCTWCKKMDAEVFRNPEISKILARDFITIRVNTEGNEQITFKGKTYSPQDFSGAVGVSGLPTLLFIDKNGELVTKLPGYIPVETLKPILGYMKSECYAKKISFDDYKNGKVKCR